ncbi:hypothetical protein TNCV_1065021 [Trichonephila clavipes]|nr:hypothetical protein TNCV_1065021 [Trichonephila clavipes]
MRPDSRVMPRRKKGDEHPPPQDARKPFAFVVVIFRVHQDTTGQQSSASTEKVTNTHRRAAAEGCRCHRSACKKTRPNSRVESRRKKDTNTHRRVSATRPDKRVAPRRKKVTNTHRRAAAVGCRCHRSACRKTRLKQQGSVSTEKGDEHPPSRVRGRMSLSSFRMHQNATGQQSSASTEKGDEHPRPRGRGRMSLSSFRVQQDATGQMSSAWMENI